jgi:regulator of nucleoside diphosphate kinase
LPYFAENDMTDLPDIQISKGDFTRLDQLLATLDGTRLSKAAEFLLRELSRATIVDAADMPANRVTMHSQVVFQDEATGRQRTVVLVYPSERTAGDDALSVLTPVGAALIGLAKGQSITFEGLDGTERRVTVLQVHHPVEAQND